MPISSSQSDEIPLDIESTELLSRDPAQELIAYVQAVLRLLGVYLFVIGASGVAEDLAGMVANWRRDIAVYGDAMLFGFIVFPERCYGSLVYLFAGLYLMIGGQWLIRNVFLSASLPQERYSQKDVDDDLEEVSEVT